MQGAAHEPSSPLGMPGTCQLTPQAAAALHFWLNQTAASPHMQATYLHNMHAGMTDPGHAFPGWPPVQLVWKHVYWHDRPWPCFPRLASLHVQPVLKHVCWHDRINPGHAFSGSPPTTPPNPPHRPTHTTWCFMACHFCVTLELLCSPAGLYLRCTVRCIGNV